MQKLSKEILQELKKIADKVWVSLKDLLFWNWENIIILKNEANNSNLKKAINNNNISIESKIENNALKTIINIPDNYKSDVPLHFCFILDKKWSKQAVQSIRNIWKNSKIKVFAYCFWVEYEIIHWDWKTYNLSNWSSLEIYEFNYNSNNSYMKVYNNFIANLWKNSYFKNYYMSTVWNLWHDITKWEIYCNWENSTADIIIKNKILKNDISDVNIKINLIWKKSSWFIQSKSITYDWWTNKFVWTIIWKWDYSKWHIECDEISMWNCFISTSPQLIVENSTSRLTHEASVWTLEKKSIENLLIKWFNEEQAIKMLISWVLDSI